MDRGDIIIDGKSIREIPDIKLRREIGYVVQEGGLFPHFTVKENLEIVPQLEGLEPEKREQRIMSAFRRTAPESGSCQGICHRF